MNYSNIHDDKKRDISKSVNGKDKHRLREMAERWMEIALSDGDMPRISKWVEMTKSIVGI